MEPTPPGTTRDAHDRKWAHWMREEFGGKGWLVYWYPPGDPEWNPDGKGWLARLSCPEHPETVEADGPTRCLAIGRAHRRLQAILDEARRCPPAE